MGISTYHPCARGLCACRIVKNISARNFSSRECVLLHARNSHELSILQCGSTAASIVVASVMN